MPLSKVKKILLRLVNKPGFWMALAALPAIMLYINRFLIPETATDTMTYHLFNGERGAHNLLVPFLPNEFYPVGVMSLNPAYDTLNFFARSLIGYRLGTIISLLAMLGIIVVLYKLLSLVLKEQGKSFHAGWGLLLVNASIVLELYFQLATYFIDIVNAFLVLTLFYLIIRYVVLKKSPPHLPTQALFCLGLGSLLLFKFTNAALVLPLILLVLWNLYDKRRSLGLKQGLLLLGCFFFIIVPLVPMAMQNYALARNPVYPFYNAIFGSPYYDKVNFNDNNFGGHTTAEKVFWPLVSANQQQRLAEPHHIYDDYKLITYWLVGLLAAGLVSVKAIRIGRVSKVLIYYFLASIFLWGILFGINRYAAVSMTTGGLLIAVLFAAEYRVGRAARHILLIGGVVVCALLLVENIRIVRFNLKYDMSWRPSLFSNLQLHRQQMGSLFSNRLRVSSGQLTTIQGADLLLNCHANVAGPNLLLPGTGRKPALNIIGDRLPHYAAMSEKNIYQQASKARLQPVLPVKTTYSWVAVVSSDLGPNQENCLRAIAKHKGQVTSLTSIDSFLGYQGVHLYLMSGTLPL
jgi:hypothetical protein